MILSPRQRLVLQALAGVLLLAMLCLAFWWFFIRPGAWRQQAAQAKVDATLGNATAAIATGAIDVVNTHHTETIRIETATREGEHAIHQAEGADAPAPAVAAALRAAVCLRGAHAAQPDCAALRDDRQGGEAAGADPGRGTAP